MESNALTNFLLEQRYRDVLSLIKGFRNGAVYGAKIRFPHALVMTFLFGKGNTRDKLRTIIDSTMTHSKNLGTFVFVYKSMMMFQKRFLQADKKKEHSIHSFVAGLIGGYFVWGNYSNINYQIVLYLTSRISVAIAKLIFLRFFIGNNNNNIINNNDNININNIEIDENVSSQTYPIFAAIVWGLVMWLFRWERETLQPSLQSSMEYLYNDSNHWTSFRNWILHNK